MGHCSAAFKVPASEKWLRDIRNALAFEQVKTCSVPTEYKDLNDWRKGRSRTDADIFKALLDAVDLPLVNPANPGSGVEPSSAGSQTMRLSTVSNERRSP
jgi:hypothetical protein